MSVFVFKLVSRQHGFVSVPVVRETSVPLRRLIAKASARINYYKTTSAACVQHIAHMWYLGVLPPAKYKNTRD